MENKIYIYMKKVEHYLICANYYTDKVIEIQKKIKELLKK